MCIRDSITTTTTTTSTTTITTTTTSPSPSPSPSPTGPARDSVPLRGRRDGHAGSEASESQNPGQKIIKLQNHIGQIRNKL
eukprot:8650238-Heterocapsa_arctica.AAC.1